MKLRDIVEWAIVLAVAIPLTVAVFVLFVVRPLLYIVGIFVPQ